MKGIDPKRAMNQQQAEEEAVSVLDEQGPQNDGEEEGMVEAAAVAVESGRNKMQKNEQRAVDKEERVKRGRKETKEEVKSDFETSAEKIQSEKRGSTKQEHGNTKRAEGKVTRILAFFCLGEFRFAVLQVV